MATQDRQMSIVVRDVMSTQLVTLAADETVSLAEQLMRAIEARHLPVLGEGDRLVGIVSDRDLLRAAASSLAGLHEEDARTFKRQIRVDQIMSRNIAVAKPETMLRDAAKLMRANKISCLPVVEGERLVGLVTETDLVDVLISALEGQDSPPPATPQT